MRTQDPVKVKVQQEAGSVEVDDDGRADGNDEHDRLAGDNLDRSQAIDGAGGVADKTEDVNPGNVELAGGVCF